MYKIKFPSGPDVAIPCTARYPEVKMFETMCLPGADFCPTHIVEGQ